MTQPARVHRGRRLRACPARFAWHRIRRGQARIAIRALEALYQKG